MKRCHLLFNDNFAPPPSLQFDLLLKLLEDDEEASSSHQHTTGIKRSYPGRRDVRTVGCQVGGFSAVNDCENTFQNEFARFKESVSLWENATVLERVMLLLCRSAAEAPADMC